MIVSMALELMYLYYVSLTGTSKLKLACDQEAEASLNQSAQKARRHLDVPNPENR